MKKLILSLLCSVAINIYGQERIILLNEGNWQADNGKMSYFEDGKVVSNQWFRDVNKRKLGDTPNDIIQINKTLIAITINWSNIIQFISPDGKRVAETEDVPNNRKLATDGRYVYVSSYGHECATIYGYATFTRGYVAKIDTETFKVVATCEVGYEPEGIAYYEGHLFVANTGGYAFQEDHEYETTVSIINAETMQLEKNIDTGQINLYGNCHSRASTCASILRETIMIPLLPRLSSIARRPLPVRMSVLSCWSTLPPIAVRCSMATFWPLVRDFPIIPTNISSTMSSLTLAR